MRIRNDGKAKIIFNGGVLEPGKCVIFKGEMEKVGAALLEAYPTRLIDLDAKREEDVVVETLGEEKGDAEQAAPAPQPKAKKKK